AGRAAEIDRSEQYPWDNVALLRDAGFFGMTIPPVYGGQGASYLDAVLVIEEMAKCCGVTGRIVVEANMGAIGHAATLMYATAHALLPYIFCGDYATANALADEVVALANEKGASY